MLALHFLGLALFVLVTSVPCVCAHDDPSSSPLACQQYPPIFDGADDLIEDLGLVNYDSARERVALSIFVHMVEGQNAQGVLESFTLQEVEELIASMNEVYGAQGIDLHLVGTDSHPPGARPPSYCPPISLGDTNEFRLDMYLLKNASGATGSSDPAVLRFVTSDKLQPDISTWKASHELGHALALWHSQEQLMSPKAPNPCGYIDTSQSPPQSDGYLCGDFIADNGFSIQSGVTVAGVDATTCDWYPYSEANWGNYDFDEYLFTLEWTAPRDVMSYYDDTVGSVGHNDNCGEYLTIDQGKRIKCNIEFNRQDYGVVEVDPGDGLGYVFWAAIFPAEHVTLPIESESFFGGEGFDWTTDLLEFDGKQVVDQVSIEVRDAIGTIVYSTGGFVANESPFPGWTPGAAEFGETLTVDVTFKNRYSPYLHTESRTFPAEDITSRTEQVTAPDAGAEHTLGAIDIRWTTNDSYRGEVGTSELVLDVVDIYLSRDGGVSYPELIVAGTPNDGGHAWSPAIGDYCAQAQIKVVFRNVANASTVESVSPGPFLFGGMPYTFANRSADTELDDPGPSQAHEMADPYGVLAWNYDAGSGVSGAQYTDLFESYLTAGAMPIRTSQLSGDGVPRMEALQTQTFLSHPLDAPTVTGYRGLAAGNFDTNSDVWVDADQGPDLFIAHALVPRVYQNIGRNGQEFVQLKDVSGDYFPPPDPIEYPLGHLVDSWAGHWFDANGDGLLDLLVGCSTVNGGVSNPSPSDVSGQELRLFLQRNDSQNRGFDRVTDMSAIGLGGSFAAHSLVVDDFTGDGAPDIVVGDFASGGSSTIFVNDGDGTFTELTNALPGSVSGLAAADLNSDGNLDLVVTLQTTGASAKVYPGNGDGAFGTAVDLNVGVALSGLQVFDQDANLVPDLLLLPANATDAPRFFANFSSPTIMSFIDRTSNVQLTAVGRVSGAATADFDGDGRKDLFLGRKIEGGNFFYRSQKPVPTDPDLPHIAVALEGGGGGNSFDGNGAVVTILSGGQPLLSQTMGASVGRGSQTALPLSFVLADDQVSYEAHVLWPEGQVQTVPLALGQLNTIQDSTNPSIVPSSMSSSYSPGPGGTMSLTFEWDCSNQSVHGNDRVHLSSTAGCLGNPLVFAPSDPNVTMQCTLRADGSERHQMTVSNLSCIPNCVYTWWCESGTSFVVSETSSSAKTFKTKLCVQ